MKSLSGFLHATFRCLFFILAVSRLSHLAAPIVAQETSGVPGSPSATSTISGKQLPAPPRIWWGIKDGALKSRPWWSPRSSRRVRHRTSC